jgi:hypothetical protein
MRNTFKFIGFIAVVAVIGLSFAACGPDEDERLITFENHSGFTIEVRCAGSTLVSDGSPANFQLDPWSGQLADPYPKEEVSKIGSNITVSWNIKDSPGKDYDKANVDGKQEGGRFIFSDK